jgi:hypothetical protein
MPKNSKTKIAKSGILSQRTPVHNGCLWYSQKIFTLPAKNVFFKAQYYQVGGNLGVKALVDNLLIMKKSV